MKTILILAAVCLCLPACAEGITSPEGLSSIEGVVVSVEDFNGMCIALETESKTHLLVCNNDAEFYFMNNLNRRFVIYYESIALVKATLYNEAIVVKDWRLKL